MSYWRRSFALDISITLELRAVCSDPFKFWDSKATNGKTDFPFSLNCWQSVARSRFSISHCCIAGPRNITVEFLGAVLGDQVLSTDKLAELQSIPMNSMPKIKFVQ